VSRTIRLFEPHDFDRVHQVCVAAFTQIHQGFERELGPEIFANQYDGWRERYADDIKRLTNDPATEVHVVEDDGLIVGFVTTTVDPAKRFGELGLNGVDPAHQGKGIGKQMYAFALQNMKSRGARIATVGTGADANHAAARRAYEAMGFDRSIPAVYYFRTL
jgi:ribosomal protein S18 acetylase RimI-like enzyme